jgi:hypothetical protein
MTNKVLALLTLLAPLPEGYAVYLSITTRLFWPAWVAAPSAGIVALIGFFAIQVAERMSAYNATLRLDEKSSHMQAPIIQAYAALAIWFVGSTTLILFLDSAMVAVLAPVALVVIGASGSYVRSLSVGQDGREQERAEYRTRVARKRQESKEQGAGKVGKQTGKKPQVARNRIDEPELLAYLQANAGASQREVAEHFGVTRQAVGARIKTLYPAIPPKGQP